MVIAAYREREDLADKLRALAAQDYPADRLQVIVVVDEDRETAEIARDALPGALVMFSTRARRQARGAESRHRRGRW